MVLLLLLLWLWLLLFLSLLFLVLLLLSHSLFLLLLWLLFYCFSDLKACPMYNIPRSDTVSVICATQKAEQSVELLDSCSET